MLSRTGSGADDDGSSVDDSGDDGSDCASTGVAWSSQALHIHAVNAAARRHSKCARGPIIPSRDHHVIITPVPGKFSDAPTRGLVADSSRMAVAEQGYRTTRRATARRLPNSVRPVVAFSQAPGFPATIPGASRRPPNSRVSFCSLPPASKLPRLVFAAFRRRSSSLSPTSRASGGVLTRIGRPITTSPASKLGLAHVARPRRAF
jgi:hypothetical protein